MFKLTRYINKNLRRYSTQHAKQEKLKYTGTINLPRTNFANRLNIKQRTALEQQLLQNTFAKAYAYQELHNKEPTFVLHDGPPYANGDLHMGHAVNKILKDITLRKHIVKGLKVHYVPGWDCHGLPIELKAMTAHKDAAVDNDPMSIRNNCRKFALNAFKRQMEEFRSWGIMSDWENKDKIYLTIQPKFIINELNLFLELYNKGMVYRDLKPVYWSPSSGTALAESELEYNDNYTSPSLYIRFALNVPNYANENQAKLYALIWTTTPWTLPSNQAICYNNAIDYVWVQLTKPDGSKVENELYLMSKKLIKNFEELTNYKCQDIADVESSLLSTITYQHPINKQQTNLPFYYAAHVQDNKGTGLVHTAPAHGPDDFLISLEHKMPVLSLINEQGVYTQDAPDFLHEKSVLSEGNQLVLQHLNNDIVHLGEIQHSYPIDWRTKEPVIIRASEQWFINTQDLKERAVQEVCKVQIFPRVNADASKKSMVAQILKRPYWCISRQRIWGVPIPVFYKKSTGEVVTNDKIIQQICKLIATDGNVDFWWSKTVDEILPKELLDELELVADDLVKGKDIFDIWFDSGSTWSAVLQDKQVADVYLEGYDQFTGWFQSSLLTSIAARDCSPYKALFVHGFAVDANGHKMSKSVGNVISPNDITKKYGVDALRWWVASHATQNMSITVSDNLLQQSAVSISKIRSTLRYLNGAIGLRTAEGNLAKVSTNRNNHLNKYLLSNLVDAHAELMQHYDAYEYNRVVATLNNFVSNQVSAIYVHLIKDRLYCGDNKDLANVRFTLSKCYEIMCKCLWPIMPFLVEESWQYYAPKSAFHEQAIIYDASWKNDEIVKIVNNALEVKRFINQKAGDVNTWQLAVKIECFDIDTLNMLRKLQPAQNTPVSNSELSEILQVGNVTLHLKKYLDDKTTSGGYDISFARTGGELCPRCRRFTIASCDKVCVRCLNTLLSKGRELS